MVILVFSGVRRGTAAATAARRVLQRVGALFQRLKSVYSKKYAKYGNDLIYFTKN